MRYRLIGLLVLALGVAGYVRGAVPLGSSTSPVGRVTVTGATIAAGTGPSTTGSFTVYDTTRAADAVVGVASGAGASVSVTNGVIPAGGNRVVSIVISQLFGPLRAGDTVSLQIDFRTAPTLVVTARVVPQASRAQSVQPSSGVRS